MPQRLIFVRTAERLQDLVGSIGDDVAFVDDLLAFLHEAHRRRECRKQLGLHVHRSRGIEDEVRRDLITVFGVRGLGRIDLRKRIFVLTDRDARIAFGLEPFHVLKRDDFHLALHARDIFQIRCEGRKQLRLLLAHLVVGLVYREVKIGRERSIAPGLSDLVMIAEGVVIAREDKNQHKGQDGKNAQAKYGSTVF